MQMQKLMSRALLLGAMLALPTVLQAEPPAKVLVAHLAEVIEEFEEGTDVLLGTTYLYNVISVSERSLPAHLGHGDAVDGGELIDGSIWTESFKGDKFEIFIGVEEPEPEPEPAP
jgi:hypothetical protein